MKKVASLVVLLACVEALANSSGSGAALPATCTVGDSFFLTTTPRGRYDCTATNVWHGGASNVSTTVTGDTTLTDSHFTVLVNAVGATPPVLTLPAASGRSGKKYTVINIGVAPIRIAPAGSDEIDGENTTRYLSNPYGASTEIYCDGTRWHTVKHHPAGVNPRMYQSIFDHFQATSNAGSTGVTATVSGTGASVVGDLPGSLLGLSTGTDTTGRASSHLGVGVGYKSESLFCTEIGIVMSSSLSSAGESYGLYVGFGDTTGAGDQVDGMYFGYNHAVNSGKWTINSANNSTRTQADSGVTVTASAVYAMRVCVDGEVPAAYYFINDTYAGTITTNLPDNNIARAFAHYFVKIEKAAGSTSRSVFVDYYHYSSYAN